MSNAERAVAIDRQLVAAVVTQDQARPFQILHGAADREIGGAAAHDDVADVGVADRAAGIRHRARLVRIGWLRSHGDVVVRAASPAWSRNLNPPSAFTVTSSPPLFCRTSPRPMSPTTVPATENVLDCASDSHVVHVGAADRAVTAGDRAHLRRVRRRSRDSHVILRAARHRRLEREAAIRRDRQVVAAVELQHEAGAGKTAHSAADREAVADAVDRDVVDVGPGDRARAVADRALLRWIGGLRAHQHLIAGAVLQSRLECEAHRCGRSTGRCRRLSCSTRPEPARPTGDPLRAADREAIRSARDFHVARVGAADRASRIAHDAVLSARLRAHDYRVSGAIDQPVGECERTVSGRRRSRCRRCSAAPGPSP